MRGVGGWGVGVLLWLPFLLIHRCVGQVVKVSVWRATDPEFDCHLVHGDFTGRVTPDTYKLVLQWLPCQETGVVGSSLELLGPVSVHCDWVRKKV